jgi:acyl-CoA hydrolase
MNIQREYNNKLVSAQQAVQHIKSGDVVKYGHFLNCCVALDRALSKRLGEITDLTINAGGYMGVSEVVKVDPNGEHIRYTSAFYSPFERMMAKSCACMTHVPMLYHEIGSYEEYLPSDVMMIRTAAMDSHGYFNFGACTDNQRDHIDHAKRIIVEVNPDIPYCLGGSRESLHISEVDCIVEADDPVFAFPKATPTDTEKKIAAHVVDFIEDGACIQLGVGGIPNSVGKLIAESDLKELGVHTEMMVDAYLEMYKAGRITNRNKKLDKGKMVFSFMGGSRELYDFVHKNPLFASYPTAYTNKPENVAMNPKVVSINGAIEVDLFGQVSSESNGLRHISGTGGQFDFHYGAYHSKGGKAFICLESTMTDKDGNIHSRIRPTFDPYTVVTLPRSVVHHVATEYGVAQLKGKSVWQRTEALINIAHPDFRDELIRDAEKMNIWRPEKRRDYVEDNVMAIASTR